MAPAGSPVAPNAAIASPSASDAVTVNVTSAPSAPAAVAGAETTGARSWATTAIDVVAANDSAFDAVNVTP